MKKQQKTTSSEIVFSEIIWLIFLILLAFGGLYLVIYGTGASTVSRYSFPPQILPGVALLYIFAFGLAGTVVKKPSVFPSFLNLRRFMADRLNVKSASSLKNMVLLLTFLMVAFAFTDGSSLRTPLFAKTYFFGLFINIFNSLISSFGVFGWSVYLFLSKNTKEKL